MLDTTIPVLEVSFVSTEKQGPRILARTFFTQLRASGYTPQQIIAIATELLDLVTEDLKEVKEAEKAALALQATQESRGDWRQEA
jgi:hypothetical protein